MLILATSSQTFHSYFPLFDVDHLKVANCSNLTIVFYPLGNFGQALCIRSCHKDLILKRKSHDCSGIAFIQGDSAGGSKLIEETLRSKFLWVGGGAGVVDGVGEVYRETSLKWGGGGGGDITESFQKHFEIGVGPGVGKGKNFVRGRGYIFLRMIFYELISYAYLNRASVIYFLSVIFLILYISSILVSSEGSQNVV